MQTAVSNAELEGDGELRHGAFSASLYVAISHSGSNNLEIAIEDIQCRFGRDAIRLASSMNGLKVQKDKSHEQLTMPAAMYV